MNCQTNGMMGQFFPYADTAPRKKFPFLTVSLIAINVLVFFWSLGNLDSVVSAYGFVPVAATLLTLFTSMFIHAGFDHIFGNMWYLWIFGDNVEDRLGRAWFLMLYFGAGIAAAGAQYITDPSSAIPSVGASGAISGVLGAYLVFFPKARILTGGFAYALYTLPAGVVIGFWFVMQLFFGAASLAGASGSNIAFWAHVGGFLFGLMFALLRKALRKIY